MLETRIVSGLLNYGAKEEMSWSKFLLMTNCGHSLGEGCGSSFTKNQDLIVLASIS